MSKATVKLGDGRSVLVLGLSRENTRRLHAGQPIEVRTADVDPRLPELTLWLVAGETEEAIGAMLRREIRTYETDDPPPAAPQ